MNNRIKPAPKRERWFFAELNWLLVLCIVLPILFLVILEITRSLYLGHMMSRESERFTVISIMLVGVLLFSNFVFSIIRRLQRAADDRGRQLRVINEIGLELSAEHQLEDLLDSVVRGANNVLNVSYGAIAITREDGEIGTFVVCDEAGRTRQVLSPPRANGILGHIVRDGRTLLIDDLITHPGFTGFPNGHANMQSFLGVPIVNSGRVLGGLYVCDKHNGEKFAADDLSTLTLLAAQTSVAINNAQLYDSLQRLSVLEERQRIAMELHDGAIQSLYAVGLQLESLIDSRSVGDKGEILVAGASSHVSGVVAGVNGVIKDLRSHIFELSNDDARPRLLSGALQEEAVRLRAHGIVDVVVGINPSLSEDVDAYLANIERAVHEAVSNIIRHSQATRAVLQAEVKDGEAHVSISDNGCGLVLDQVGSMRGEGEGQGLGNIRRRLENLGGVLEIDAAEGKGYCARMKIPLSRG